MPDRVHFFKEDIKFRLPEKAPLVTWITETIKAEGFRLKEVNFIFCSDQYLHSLNKDFLNHDTFTDIVTFDNSEQPKTIEGDVFISIDRVRENSETFNEPFPRELRRVMVHGILHLLGYSDKGSKNKLRMRQLEDRYLGEVPRGTLNKQQRSG